MPVVNPLQPAAAPMQNEACLPASNNAVTAAVKRIRSRLVPFLMLMYVISFLDRSNIGFAKQALQTSVGISPASYALAAGLFFISYSFCGFPSNLILHRVGAKVWMTCIMTAWGLASMATMFVTGDVSLYTVRLLLGVTEAGFFPGVILYLTYWFPSRTRGEIMGLFYIGVPIAMIFGNPLSGFLLQMRTLAGLQGWQWMFFIEGLIAVLVGIGAYWYLDDRPIQASWIPAEEKAALTELLSAEQQQRRSSSPANLRAMIRDPRVLLFLAIYSLIQISVYGVVFYLPTEVSALLHKPAGIEVGFVSAIPWLFALFAVFWLPRAAGISQRHRSYAALTMFVGGLASLAFPTAGPVVGILALSIAVSAFVGVQPLFWTFPTSYLADRAAAGGIAVITMGNLGGFIAPNLKVWADRFFGSESAGLYLLAGLTLLNAGLILMVSDRSDGAAIAPGPDPIEKI
jgi:MFS family permease